VSRQGAAVPPPISASLILLHPPAGDTIELYLRLKSLQGAAMRTAQYTAAIQLADGKTLTANGTGDGEADPLYATLPNAEYCALHGKGDLSLKVTLINAAVPVSPQRLAFAFDLAKISGAAAFAAKHCGK
jgi:hypothetical protein